MGDHVGRMSKDAASSPRGRSISSTVVVSPQTDPLESLRARLPEHEAKAKALLRVLQQIDDCAGKLDESQRKASRLFRNELMEPTTGAVNHEYSQACTLLVNQLDAMHEAVLDAQCELAGAVCFAEEMVDRNHELQARLLQRDKTNGQLERCIMNVEELSQKATKHRGRDYDQQIIAALDKYHAVEREAEVLDRSATADLRSLIEHENTDYARVLAPFSRYLGVAASTEANTAYILARKIPNILRSAVHQDLTCDRTPIGLPKQAAKGEEDVTISGGTTETSLEEPPKTLPEGSPRAHAEEASKALAEGSPRAHAEEASKALAEGSPRAHAEEASKALAEGSPRAHAEEASKALPEGSPRARAEEASEAHAESSELKPTSSSSKQHEERTDVTNEAAYHSASSGDDI